MYRSMALLLDWFLSFEPLLHASSPVARIERWDNALALLGHHGGATRFGEPVQDSASPLRRVHAGGFFAFRVIISSFSMAFIGSAIARMTRRKWRPDFRFHPASH
jgi:hypothetical protein